MSSSDFSSDLFENFSIKIDFRHDDNIELNNAKRRLEDLLSASRAAFEQKEQRARERNSYVGRTKSFAQYWEWQREIFLLTLMLCFDELEYQLCQLKLIDSYTGYQGRFDKYVPKICKIVEQARERESEELSARAGNSKDPMDWFIGDEPIHAMTKNWFNLCAYNIFPLLTDDDLSENHRSKVIRLLFYGHNVNNILEQIYVPIIDDAKYDALDDYSIKIRTQLDSPKKAALESVKQRKQKSEKMDKIILSFLRTLPKTTPQKQVQHEINTYLKSKQMEIIGRTKAYELYAKWQKEV